MGVISFRSFLLLLGGILEFVALLLLSSAYFTLAGMMGAFPPADLVRLAYGEAGWGYLVAAFGFPVLAGGFALPRRS